MSEQYIVSARKYRPQTFDTVVGQQHITTTLKNAILNNQLAHAYLFCGPRGVGKTSCARILARTINCEMPTPEMEACGYCSTCLSFKENTALNIFELDAASNNSVDDIRRLTEQVRYAPQHGRYKIYIIDEVHMLSTSAFNAFLKTLEEPPSYAIFILATTEKHKILPTILSRCQIFDFKRIQTADIVAHLSAICQDRQLQCEQAALHVLAQKSEGCMRDALSLMDRIAGFADGKLNYAAVVEHLNILDADVFFKLSNYLMTGDLAGLLISLDNIIQKGFDGDQILNGFMEHFRNLLLSKDGKMARLLDLSESHKRSYFENAQVIPQEYILSALSILNEAELNYKSATNKRLHLEITFIRLCYLNELATIADPPQEGFEKKKLARPETPPATTQAPPSPEAPNEGPERQGRQPEGHQVPTEVAGKESEQPSETQASNSEEDQSAYKPAPPTAKKPPKPQLTKNLLAEIQKSAASELVEDEQIKLTNELAAELFKEYQEGLREHPHELPALAQLEMMEISCVDDEEVQLVCNSQINAAYGQTKSADFREFCSMRTGIKNVRVTVFLDESKVEKEPAERVLSRLEIFDLMAQENPLLRELKDGLGLSVE